MPNCPSIDRLVTPYVDGELPTEDFRAVEQHLGFCSPCRARMLAERAVRDLLHARQQSLQEDCAPGRLRSRCAELAHRSGATGSSAGPRFGAASAVAGWRGRLRPLAFAATLVLVVGAAFLYQATARYPRLLAAELTADHIKCFALNSVLRTRQNPEAVESSMASGFGWDVSLPAHAERAGLELVGSRPCLYGDGKVAHIMYRHNGQPVSLFMLPRTQRSDQLVKVFGHEAAIWCVGDRTFVLVAREPRSDVQRMAEFIHAALH
jgi:anti-sigma factor RsiW